MSFPSWFTTSFSMKKPVQKLQGDLLKFLRINLPAELDP